MVRPISAATLDPPTATKARTAATTGALRECQDTLTEIAGYAPVAISYPNGDHSAEVVEAARQAGLRLGLTVRPCRNRLPLNGGDARLMKLGRFYFYGDNDPRDELLKWRAGFLPSNFIKRAFKKAH